MKLKDTARLIYMV